MTYGERLHLAMEIAEKDRAALAAALGVSVQSIGQTITGNTNAHTAENCAKAAKFLRVDMYWLATGQGQPRTAEPPLMAERMALSVEAVKHAAAFDKLSDRQRRTWRTLLMTVRTAATDARVEQSLPPSPRAAKPTNR